METKYVNGVFITKKTGIYGDFFSMDINKKQMIEYLQDAEEDSRGMVKFKLNYTKADPNKLSMEPLKVSTPAQSEKPSGKKKSLDFDSTDLPF